MKITIAKMTTEITLLDPHIPTTPILGDYKVEPELGIVLKSLLRN